MSHDKPMTLVTGAKAAFDTLGTLLQKENLYLFGTADFRSKVSAKGAHFADTLLQNSLDRHSQRENQKEEI
ncbi:hypothetical protein [Metabacillus sp. Hm71]|uniref:hypothetical protein n=1 Tax=Metabacillus sp. Hm71 TaxID=3450743 RepID=UPI003F4435F1